MKECAVKDNILLDTIHNPNKITVAQYKALTVAKTEHRIVTGVQQKQKADSLLRIVS